MKGRLNFKSGEYISLDLLETPITQLWKDAHIQNLTRGNKVVGTLNCVGIQNGTLQDQFVGNEDVIKKEIQLINEGIKITNESISGDKFPYVAFYKMPWMQVNRIHRCFTTASVKKGIWYHNLNTLELIQAKIEQYKSRYLFFSKVLPTYEVLDEQKFNNGIELINKHIHMYERFLHTQRSSDFHNFYQDLLSNTFKIDNNCNFNEFPNSTTSIYTEFNWDNFDEFGGKAGVYTNRTTFEEIKQSTPADWESYDIYLNKCIAGKDYEHAYFNYDDPLEADITNVDGIDGGIRLHYDKNLSSFYNYKPFVDWYREKGVEDTLVRPVPLGRINREESSNKLSQVQFLDANTQTTSGYPTLPYPFDQPLGIEFID